MSLPTSNIMNLYADPKNLQHAMKSQSEPKGNSSTFAQHLSQENMNSYRQKSHTEPLLSKATIFGKENILIDKILFEHANTLNSKNEALKNAFASPVQPPLSANRSVGIALEFKRDTLASKQGQRFNVSEVVIGEERANITRKHNYNKATIDYQRTNALGMLSQEMKGGSTLLDMARNSVSLSNLQHIVSGYSLSSPDYLTSMREKSTDTANKDNTKETAQNKSSETMRLGSLSAKFESGSDGISSIGYDRNGGTSYGKYQIASRVGSMENFLKDIDVSAPDIAARLREAGPANTGSRSGGMPSEWKKIAEEQPERFEQLQEKFIHDNYYKPTLAAITEKTSLKEKDISPAMEEVIWSTAIQHGTGAAVRIFDRADNGIGDSKDEQSYNSELINAVYDIRSRQFGSSTEQVRKSVHNRLNQERSLALDMLEGKKIELA